MIGHHGRAKRPLGELRIKLRWPYPYAIKMTKKPAGKS